MNSTGCSTQHPKHRPDHPATSRDRAVRWLAGTTVAVLMTAAALALSSAGSRTPALAATTPGWEPDQQAIGYVSFADAHGNLVTSGRLDSHPFAAYAVASHRGRTGDTIASLYAATPQVGTNPQTWSSDLLSSSTYDPAPNGAPGSVAGSRLPFVTGASNDFSFNDYISEYPNTLTTSGYQNLYELRIYTSGPDQAGDTSAYDRVDIRVDPSTNSWSVVYPADSLAGLPASSASPTPTASATTSTTSTPRPTASPTPTATPTATAGGPTSTRTPAPAGSTAASSPSTSRSSTAQPSTTPSGAASPTGLSVTDSSGRPLTGVPTLHRGETVTVSADGFRPRERVAVTLHSAPTVLTPASAGPRGVVDYPFTVPAHLASGAHRLVFTATSRTESWSFRVVAGTAGSGSITTGSTGSGSTGTGSTSTGSTSTGSTSTGSTSTGSTSTGSTGTGSTSAVSTSTQTGDTTPTSGRRLPFTGLQASALVLVALAALGAGVVLVLAGRRHRAHAVAVNHDLER